MSDLLVIVLQSTALVLFLAAFRALVILPKNLDPPFSGQSRMLQRNMIILLPTIATAVISIFTMVFWSFGHHPSNDVRDLAFLLLVTVQVALFSPLFLGYPAWFIKSSFRAMFRTSTGEPRVIERDPWSFPKRRIWQYCAILLLLVMMTLGQWMAVKMGINVFIDR